MAMNEEYIDPEEELLDRVKRIEKGIEEIYKLLRPQQAQTTDMHCNEHGELMQRAVSKKTGKPYTFHRSPDGQMCFGRGYVAS